MRVIAEGNQLHAYAVGIHIRDPALTQVFEHLGAFKLRRREVRDIRRGFQKNAAGGSADRRVCGMFFKGYDFHVYILGKNSFLICNSKSRAVSMSLVHGRPVFNVHAGPAGHAVTRPWPPAWL